MTVGADKEDGPCWAASSRSVSRRAQFHEGEASRVGVPKTQSKVPIGDAIVEIGEHPRELSRQSPPITAMGNRLNVPTESVMSPR
jgi:hypothetical protein